MTPAAAYTRPASTMLPQQNKLSLRGVQAQASRLQLLCRLTVLTMLKSMKPLGICRNS